MRTKHVSRVFAAWLLAAAIPLHAQDYPKGAVTLVIPLAPGDATDTSARAIADELSRELKVAIVPVNRPGAGGAVGTETVVKAKPDGYTIILTNNAALVFRSILDPNTANYNPLTDLTPLGLAMRSPSVLAVRGDAPYKSLAELVATRKKIRTACASAPRERDRWVNSAFAPSTRLPGRDSFPCRSRAPRRARRRSLAGTSRAWSSLWER